MVGFPPGHATDSHCLFRYCEAIFQDNCVVALSEISDCVLGTPELVDVVNILIYVELGVAIIQRTRLALTHNNNRIGQEIFQVMVQFCFQKYSLCSIHTENNKAEVAAASLDTYKR